MLSAAKELVEIFKFPKENEQLLSSYAIDIRQPAQEQSITGDTPQQTTRWGVDEVDWQQLARMGVTPESLGETGIQRLLNGHESAVLDIRISFEGIDFETPACIRLVESAGGKPVPERGMLQAVSRTGPAVHGYGAFSRSERESFQEQQCRLCR
ncbi:DUF4099 domain-containing protein [Bacteroides ovatus]|nr:DUF4099 domain-containing protein [Bacteroides ovatus]